MCSYENRASPVSRDLALGDRDLIGMKMFQLRMTERSFSGRGGSILAYLPNFPFQKFHLAAVIKLRELTKLRPEARRPK